MGGAGAGVAEAGFTDTGVGAGDVSDRAGDAAVYQRHGDQG